MQMMQKSILLSICWSDLIWSDDFHITSASSPKQNSLKFARILLKNMHPQALPLSAAAICTMHHLQPRRLIHGYYIIEIEQNSYTFERRHRQTDRHRHRLKENKTKAGECEMCFPTCTESRSAPYASYSKAMKTLPQAPAPIPTIRNASPSTFPSKLRSSATLSSPNPATCATFLATSWFR